MSDTQKGKMDFTQKLFAKLILINPNLAFLEPYEFQYCLNNLAPDNDDWSRVQTDTPGQIHDLVNDVSYYRSIQLKPGEEHRIILDHKIADLTRQLFCGLVSGFYPVEWVSENFYFDIRGFYFLHRTVYFTPEVLDHFGGRPYQQFEKKQEQLGRLFEVGYQDFMQANKAVDDCFIKTILRMVEQRNRPILIAIAGPTAAGKTEIVERLGKAFLDLGKQITSVEMDNFLTDRDEREAKGIHTQGKQALHFQLLLDSLESITRGETIQIPRYDFIEALSSHDSNGCLKPGCTPLTIHPADIIFIEGNFPFLLPEISPLVGIKVVYLTSDEIRLKRKWRRDIDFRKKYEPNYFRNRFFKDQFIMAQIAYIPQMVLADLIVDTTGATLWMKPEIVKTLAEVR